MIRGNSAVWALGLAVVCLSLFAAMIVLYTCDLPSYRAILMAFGVHVEFEPYFPFVDLSEYLTSIKCAVAGKPVFTDANPCNPWHHRHTYPIALWLWWHVSPDPAWLNELGVVLGIFVVGTACCILRPCNAGEAALGLLAIASPATAYAVERGNMDEMMFLIAVAAGGLARRKAIRPLAYATLVLGGLLKYYPLAAMSLALGEQPRRFATITGLSLVVFAAFLLLAGPELHLLLHNRLVYPLLNDTFGAANAFAFFIVMLHVEQYTPRVPIPMALYLALIGLVFRHALRRSTQAKAAFIYDLDRCLFLIGGAMLIFVFFFFLNTAYREVLLLLLLPFLFRLRRETTLRAPRRLVWLIVFLVWSEFFRNHTGSEARQFLFITFVREPAWWTAMALLLELWWPQFETLASTRALRQWIDTHFDRPIHETG